MATILLYTSQADDLEILQGALCHQLVEPIDIVRTDDAKQATRHLNQGHVNFALLLVAKDLSTAAALVRTAQTAEDVPIPSVVLVHPDTSDEELRSLYASGAHAVLRCCPSLGMMWERLAVVGKFWCEVASLP